MNSQDFLNNDKNSVRLNGNQIISSNNSFYNDPQNLNVQSYKPIHNFRRRTDVTKNENNIDPNIYKLQQDLLLQIQMKEQRKKEENDRKKYLEEQEEIKIKNYWDTKMNQNDKNQNNQFNYENIFSNNNDSNDKLDPNLILSNKQNKSKIKKDFIENRHLSPPKIITDINYQPKLEDNLKKEIIKNEFNSEFNNLKSYWVNQTNELNFYIDSLRKELKEASRLKYETESDLYNIRLERDKIRESEAIMENKFIEILDQNAPYNNLHIPITDVHPLYKNRPQKKMGKLQSESEFIFERNKKCELPTHNNELTGNYLNDIYNIAENNKIDSDQRDYLIYTPEKVLSNNKHERFYLKDNIQNKGSIKYNVKQEIIDGPNSMIEPLTSESIFKPIDDLITSFEHNNKIELNSDKLRINTRKNPLEEIKEKYDYNNFYKKNISDKYNNYKLNDDRKFYKNLNLENQKSKFDSDLNSINNLIPKSEIDSLKEKLDSLNFKNVEIQNLDDNPHRDLVKNIIKQTGLKNNENRKEYIDNNNENSKMNEKEKLFYQKMNSNFVRGANGLNFNNNKSLDDDEKIDSKLKIENNEKLNLNNNQSTSYNRFEEINDYLSNLLSK